MGSTPASKVMAVDGLLGPPSVATIITASPFCKSAKVAAGIRVIICCRSPVPPPGLPIPPAPLGAELPDGGPLVLGAFPHPPLAHALCLPGPDAAADGSRQPPLHP